MADSRDFSGAADDVASAYATYLMRSGYASAHALQRYEQVLACVARRQLAPDTLHTSLMSFVSERALASQTDVSAIMARFASALGSRALLSSNGEALASDVSQSSARAWEDWIARLSAVAAGEKSPSEFRREVKKRYSESFAGDLRHTAAAWFELLGALDEERARFAEAYFTHVLRTASPVGFDRDVVELAGPINTRIDTHLTLETSLTERIVLRCVVGDVRRADGIGPAFRPNVTFAPEEIILDSNADARVSLSLTLDDTIYDAHTPYVGSLHITRDDAPRLDLPLRITPTPPTS